MVATVRLLGQLLLSEVQSVDVVEGEQGFRVADDDGRHDQTHVTLLRHHPDDTGGQQVHERQPAVVRDAPHLNPQQTDQYKTDD